ncbi:MAG: hypothetical protein M1835_005195 [Candelina submexicana]|nr:MAG: hypothetical protein M1835_005195 [Candelina submexicana]
MVGKANLEPESLECLDYKIMGAAKFYVIALISGGKDSLFSILHCQANGYEVIALANLFPPSSPSEGNHNGGAGAADSSLRNDDIDSYMYQTVGHTVIPLFEEALGIPLYRQEILGSAINKCKSYGPSASIDGAAGDETESLVPLLQRVQQAHPEANAVSTGAILSDYQRTRVESVAIRLGLIPLSYLWQFPYLPPRTHRSLLDDMAAVGQDVRIIKVASGGLDESFLWENLLTERVKGRLATAMAWFGGLEDGALLGEGGQYETLVIDGPPPLWKKRIIIDEDDKEVIGQSGGSALLRFNRVILSQKPCDSLAATRQIQPRIPALLDQEFADLRQHLADIQYSGDEESLRPGETPSNITDATRLMADQEISNAWQFSSGATACYISNIVASEGGKNADIQMRAIAAELPARLRSHARELDDIVLVTILLRFMTDFDGVNQVYGSLFTKPNPPARVTVGCGQSLPDGIDIMLAMVLDCEASKLPRKGLHVQSRSYWAPANIGPYSQAISVPTGRGDDSRPGCSVYVAGQIPLVPASMELVSDETITKLELFRLQTVLSLQHLWRIGKSMDVQWWAGVIAFFAGDDHLRQKTNIILEAWQHIHLAPSQDLKDDSDQDEIVDVDLRHGTHILAPLDRQGSRYPLPDPSMLKGLGNTPLVPPIFAVQVDQLPRGALIEWAPTFGISNNQTTIGQRSDATDSINISYTSASRKRTIYRGIDDSYPSEGLEDRLHHMIDKSLPRDCHGFPTTDHTVKSHSTVYTSRPWRAFKNKHTQIVPCKSIWGHIVSKGWGRLAAAIVWREDMLWPGLSHETFR